MHKIMVYVSKFVGDGVETAHYSFHRPNEHGSKIGARGRYPERVTAEVTIQVPDDAIPIEIEGEDGLLELTLLDGPNKGQRTQLVAQHTYHAADEKKHGCKVFKSRLTLS